MRSLVESSKPLICDDNSKAKCTADGMANGKAKCTANGKAKCKG